jgi:hypothetical protein
MATVEIWAFRDQSYGSTDLTGFKVDAVDGEVGKIDTATNDVGSSYIVVDTGGWFFGKKVTLPAGVISNVDIDTETVSVNRTKEQIKNSPQVDPDDAAGDDAYRNKLGSYYGSGGDGWRTDD